MFKNQEETKKNENHIYNVYVDKKKIQGLKTSPIINLLLVFTTSNVHYLVFLASPLVKLKIWTTPNERFV
jgi:hypothetical protein